MKRRELNKEEERRFFVFVFCRRAKFLLICCFTSANDRGRLRTLAVTRWPRLCVGDGIVGLNPAMGSHSFRHVLSVRVPDQLRSLGAEAVWSSFDCHQISALRGKMEARVFVAQLIHKSLSPPPPPPPSPT